jgi:hypothetical protein
MTYTCDPVGATLREAETNTNFGQCPTTIEYPLTKENKAAGFVNVKGLTATWVSGASVSVSSVHADLRNGRNQQFNFDRPRDVPGYETDANYALNVQRNAIMAQQAQAAANQAQAAAFANYLAATRPSPPPAPVYTAPTTCNTMAIGNTLQTRCY